MSVEPVSIATPQPNDDREIPLAYYRLPETWLDAPGARDQAPEDDEAVRLFAVSAATSGKWLITRYAHPDGGVKTKFAQANRAGDGAYPKALEKDSPAVWPRTVVPTTEDEPDGVVRGREEEWLDELWADRDVFQRVIEA